MAHCRRRAPLSLCSPSSAIRHPRPCGSPRFARNESRQQHTTTYGEAVRPCHGRGEGSGRHHHVRGLPRRDPPRAPRGERWMFVKGRLREDVPTARTAASLGAIMADLSAAYPESNEDRQVSLTATDDVRQPRRKHGAIGETKQVQRRDPGRLSLLACAASGLTWWRQADRESRFGRRRHSRTTSSSEISVDQPYAAARLGRVFRTVLPGGHFLPLRRKNSRAADGNTAVFWAPSVWHESCRLVRQRVQPMGSARHTRRKDIAR